MLFQIIVKAKPIPGFSQELLSPSTADLTLDSNSPDSRASSRMSSSTRLSCTPSPLRGDEVQERKDEDVAPRIPQPYRTSFSAVTAPKRSESSVGRARSSSPFQRKGLRLSLPAKQCGNYRSTTPNYRTSSSMVNSNAGSASKRNASPATRHMSEFGSPVEIQNYASRPPRQRVSRVDHFRTSPRSPQSSRLPTSSRSSRQTSPSPSQIPQPIRSILVNRDRNPLQGDTTPSEGATPPQSNLSSTMDGLTSPLTTEQSTAPQPEVTPERTQPPSGGRVFSYSDPRIRKNIIQKDYVHCTELSYKDQKIQALIAESNAKKGKKSQKKLNQIFASKSFLLQSSKDMVIIVIV